MKVGKPKSKRVPVRLRHKIEKASAAKQRKQRKEAKKNPQWRSRLKKDPGIPNLFPHKAKVLAEIEESKRRKEEEALRKREVAKAQRQGRSIADKAQEPENDARMDAEVLLDLEDGSEDEDAMNSQEDSNPMAALLASAQARAQAYSHDEDADGEEDENEEDEEWDGTEDENAKPMAGQATRNALPKQALADPVKAVSALLDRMQKTTDGIQRLIEYYQMPPLMTAGTDLTSGFLVEVARKRGRLGKGGVPNLHSAALTVLGDLNDERLELPSVVDAKISKASAKEQVQIVSQMAKPFRIDGLFGDGLTKDATVVEEMVVEA